MYKPDNIFIVKVCRSGDVLDRLVSVEYVVRLTLPVSFHFLFLKI